MSVNSFLLLYHNCLGISLETPANVSIPTSLEGRVNRFQQFCGTERLKNFFWRGGLMGKGWLVSGGGSGILET